MSTIFAKHLAQLSRLCEVAIACKGLPADIPEPLVQNIDVAGVRIGSVHLRCFTALARCDSST